MSPLIQVSYKNNVATLVLGSAEERAVLLDEERIGALKEAFHELARRKELRGLVICGPREEMFCAGADVQIIARVNSVREGERLAGLGQQVYQLLDDLPFATVAAISGSCVGGGYELALACDYRIALDTQHTKIGLPEVKLGILPGFGGSQRLPRLIGLPRALDIILKGRIVGARQAVEWGMVDELRSGAFADLIAYGERFAGSGVIPKRGQPSLAHRFLTHTRWGRNFVYSRARQSLHRETKGKYPAANEALDSAVLGLGMPLAEGLRQERERVARLVITPESKALVHLYFASENAQKLGRQARSAVEGVRVAVVGGGTMGAGIAVSLASNGFPVVVVEPIERVRERVPGLLRSSLDRRRGLTEEERARLAHNLSVSPSLEAISGSALLIEAIVEDAEKKRALFEQAASLLPEDAILASNTSSIRLSLLADGFPFAERFVGVHFFNPAEKMPLVEIIRGQKTSDRTLAIACALATGVGKYPVVVEDVPGFLVNKILTPYLMEASKLLREGASVEEIDTAATEFGFPMGPFRLLDEIGLDVAHKVAGIMQEAYGDRMAGDNFVQRLVEKGRLGKKSGGGFYTYEGGTERPAEDLTALFGLRGAPIDRSAITERLLAAMRAEAELSLAEGIAGKTSPEAAAQIDLASVMGFGYPPFRGGVIYDAR